MNNPAPRGFTPTITKFEMIFGLIYLPIHVFVLPLLLSVVQITLLPELTAIQGNLLYYGISAVVLLPLFWKMLRREFDPLFDRPFHCLGTFVTGYGLWFVLALAVSAVMTLLGMVEDTPNDMAVDDLVKEGYNATLLMSVIAAPILEEILFRGVLFQSIRKKHRVLAYVVNIFVFGLIHVWQYALIYGDWSYLLYIINYAHITFVLTWVYEHSGSLWTAIFFHASNNFLALQITMNL